MAWPPRVYPTGLEGETHLNMEQWAADVQAEVDIAKADLVAVAVELNNHAADALLHSSGQEVAYAENVSTIAQVATTAAVVIDGCTIVVPPNPRPVWVEASALFDVTTAAAAGATGTVSTGINVGADAKAAAILSVESAGTVGYVTVVSRYRIPPNTPEATYSAVFSKGGNATFAAQILNGGIAPAFRSYISAIAA